MFKPFRPEVKFAAQRGLGEAELTHLLIGEADRRRAAGRSGDASGAAVRHAICRSMPAITRAATSS
jgi:hypothetical protein